MLVGLSTGRECSLKRSLSLLMYVKPLGLNKRDKMWHSLFPYVILYMYFSILSF